MRWARLMPPRGSCSEIWMNRLKWMTRCRGRITLLNRDRGRENSEILLGSCDSWWCQLSLRFSVELCCCIVWISSLFVVQSYISHLSPKMCFDSNYSVFRKRFFVILQLRFCFPSPYMFWFSVPFRFEYDILRLSAVTIPYADFLHSCVFTVYPVYQSHSM